MKRTGDWHRWGRHTKGDTEGWSLNIGSAFRCSVAPVKPGSIEWHASAVTSGTYADRVRAMRAVEREVELNVAKLNSDWPRFLAAMAKRKGAVPAADERLPNAGAELEASVDEALAICDGDPRAAVRALIVANDCLEGEVERMRDLVSRAYAHGEVSRQKSSGAGGPSSPVTMGSNGMSR